MYIYIYIFNIFKVTGTSDWNKITYSQLHGSPVLKALSLQRFQKISVTTFAGLIQFCQDPKCRRFRTF